MLGPAGPLHYPPTIPELKKLIRELNDVANARLAERQGERASAQLEFFCMFTKQGGERMLWDCDALPRRAGKQLIQQLESKPVWQDDQAVIAVDEFRGWLDEGIELALKTP